MSKTWSRIGFGFQMLSVGLAWAQGALSKESEGGKDITKDEIKDLVQQILAIVGMSLDDIV